MGCREGGTGRSAWAVECGHLARKIGGRDTRVPNLMEQATNVKLRTSCHSEAANLMSLRYLERKIRLTLRMTTVGLKLLVLECRPYGRVVACICA